MADVLILCCGSRGDTEPWSLLARELQGSGLRVCVAAHGEYQQLVESVVGSGGGGALFREIRGSLPIALVETPEGAALRHSSGFKAVEVLKALMLPLAELWFEDALAAARELQPRLLLITSMHYIAGAWLIPELLRREQEQRLEKKRENEKEQEQELGLIATEDDTAGQQQQQEGEEPKEMQPAEGSRDPASLPTGGKMTVVAGHTVIAHATGWYAPPTTGVGRGLPIGFFNKLMWRLGLSMASKHLYAPVMAAIAERHGLDVRALPCADWIQYEEKNSPQTLYVFSPALLPRAPEWPASVSLVGPLLPAASRQTQLGPATANDAAAAEQLPLQLRDYIVAAKVSGIPIMYVGLGSMLGVYYDDPPALLRVLAGGVALAQAQARARGRRPQERFAAIIHTVTGARGEHAPMPPPPDGADYFWLECPVPHSALLPLVDLAVHHGGMGTTHAVAMAGRPAIIVPASKASDQPFWADVMRRHGAAVASPSPAGALTPGSFSRLLLKALKALPGMRAAAVGLAERMRALPDGVAEAAAAVIRALEG